MWWSAAPPQALGNWTPTAFFGGESYRRSYSRVTLYSQSRQMVCGLGQALKTVFNPNESEHQIALKSKQKSTSQSSSLAAAQKQEVKEQGEQLQLSGADVLMALGRAGAQKAKKNKGKKSGTAPASKFAGDGPRENEDSNARPLQIKPEWGDQLEDLGRKLEAFAQR